MIRTQWQQSLVDDLLEWYITIIAGNRELSEAGGLLWNTKKIHAYETIALIHQLKHFYCIVYVLFNRQFKSIEYDCFLDMRISISFEDIKCSFTLFFSGAPLGRGPLNGWNKNLKNYMKYIHHVHFPHIAPQNHLNFVCRRTLLWEERVDWKIGVVSAFATVALTQSYLIIVRSIENLSDGCEMNLACLA